MTRAAAPDNPAGDDPDATRTRRGRRRLKIGTVALAADSAPGFRNDQVDADDHVGLTVLAGRTTLLHAINAKVQSGSYLTASAEKFPTVVLGSFAATRMGIAKTVPGQPAPQIYTKAREDGIDAVRNVLAPTIYPELPGMVQVSRPSDALAAKRATETTFSALFLGLAAVALLVGGIGVANTMVISVLERRKEIGLRRALGANTGQIRGQFLTESVALSCLGGLAGTALGVLATVAYAAYQGWPPVIPLPAVAGGFGGAVLIGMAAGVHPSIRASRLTPTEALATA